MKNHKDNNNSGKNGSWEKKCHCGCNDCKQGKGHCECGCDKCHCNAQPKGHCCD